MASLMKTRRSKPSATSVSGTHRKKPLQAPGRTTRLQPLPATAQHQPLAFDAVGPRLIEAAGATSDPDTTLARGLNFLEGISRRGAYLALLQQYPMALRRVADMICASFWATEYLQSPPVAARRTARPAPLRNRHQLGRLPRKPAAQSGRPCRRYRARNGHPARSPPRPGLPAAGPGSGRPANHRKLSDHLTELADTIVQETLPLCWSKIKKRHCETPKFAVIGYGKMGGKELGYASDLDWFISMTTMRRMPAKTTPASASA
jgi:glutamate-ammonia-ligase adenylyltransferase